MTLPDPLLEALRRAHPGRHDGPRVTVAAEAPPIARAAPVEVPPPRRRMPEASVPRIVEVTAQIFATTPEAIFAVSGDSRAARARHVAWWLARRILQRSFPKLGRSFRRDHSSIVYGVQVVEALRERDADFAATLDALERAIRLRRPVDGAALPAMRLRKIAP